MSSSSNTVTLVVALIGAAATIFAAVIGNVSGKNSVNEELLKQYSEKTEQIATLQNDSRILNSQINDLKENNSNLQEDFDNLTEEYNRYINNIESGTKNLTEEEIISLAKNLGMDFSDNNTNIHANVESNFIFVNDLEPFVGSQLQSFDTVRDNLGNNHFNAVGGYNRANAAVTSRANNLYRINGMYSKITGLFFLRENGKNTDINQIIEIYGDDELLYKKSVTGGIEPIDFDVDIGGVNELRIVLDGSDGFYDGILSAIDNFKIYK